MKKLNKLRPITTAEKNDFFLGIFSGFEEQDFDSGFIWNKFKKKEVPDNKMNSEKIKLHFIQEKKFAFNKIGKSKKSDLSFDIEIVKYKVSEDILIMLSFDKYIILRDGSEEKIIISLSIMIPNIDYNYGKIIGLEIAKRFNSFQIGIAYEVINSFASWRKINEEKMGISSHIVLFSFTIDRIKSPGLDPGYFVFDFFTSRAEKFGIFYLPAEKKLNLAGGGNLSIKVNKKNLEEIASGILKPSSSRNPSNL